MLIKNEKPNIFGNRRLKGWGQGLTAHVCWGGGGATIIIPGQDLAFIPYPSQLLIVPLPREAPRTPPPLALAALTRIDF